jgi:hypothetical protein
MDGLMIALFSFFLGLVSGIIIQTMKFRYDRKLDRIRRVVPDLENVHPILEVLIDDIDHEIKLQKRYDSGEIIRYSARIKKGLNLYREKYTEFVAKGLKPELLSLDHELYSGLQGIFVYCQLVDNYGEETILKNLQDINRTVKETMSLLEIFLKS